MSIFISTTIEKIASQNVSPGDPITFTVILDVSLPNITLRSLTDNLPALTSGSEYTIESQSPGGFFQLQGSVGNQSIIVPGLPRVVSQGIYEVTVQANTTSLDAGEEY